VILRERGNGWRAGKDESGKSVRGRLVVFTRLRSFHLAEWVGVVSTDPRMRGGLSSVAGLPGCARGM